MRDEGENLKDVQVPLVQAQRVRVEGSAIGNIEADIANVERSLVERLQSAHTELRLCAAQAVSGNVVESSSSAVAYIKASEADLQKGAVGLCNTTVLNSELSAIGVVAAQQKTEMRGGLAGIVAARGVHAEGVRALLVVSPRIEGDIRPVLGVGQALVLGVALGLVLFVLRRLGSR